MGASQTRRWKVACGFLAALTAYSWLRGPAALTASSAAPVAASQRGAHRGPIRLSAKALGVSSQQLVQQFLDAHDVREMRDIITRLAAVGGDEVIDPLKPILRDDPDGKASMVIELFGSIGTDRAVTELVELTKDHRYYFSSSALSALGETRHPKAETFLVGYVAEHPGSYDALVALATFESDTAVATLAQACEDVEDEYQRYAFEALASIHTPAAQDALRELMDSPNLTTAMRAMDSLSDDMDDRTLAKLTAIVRSGDVELGRTALSAIAREGGESATSLLVEIARDGAVELQRLAVQGLGKMKNKQAFETLVEITESGTGDVRQTALHAIAGFETPESREFVISLALGDSNLASDAVTQLAAMNGPEVDNALLVIAQSDSNSANGALSHLLTREHPEALALVTARARRGDEDDRYEALELLVNAGNGAALDATIEIVRGERGPLRQRAFDLLARAHRSDAAVGELLRDSLRSSEPGEASAAARALANIGTTEARDALVSALSSGDSELAYSAAHSLGRYRLDDASAAALARAAESDRAVAEVATRKLLEMSSPHGMRLAENALRGDDQDLAMRTITMLREASSPAALKVVEEAVHTTEGEVRAVAVRALGDSRDPRMVDVLKTALDDGSASVRENVAYALRSIGGENARNALIDMTRSADVDDRVAALANLRDEGDARALHRIKEMLRDPEPRVVQYATYAMAQSASGAKELRALILDGSKSYEMRYEAAMALQRYDELDERTSEWLAAASPDHYSD